MTHEELLEVLEHTAQDGMADEPVLKALCAVVELHKPDEYYPEFCGVCWWEEHERETYPCQTIQAIEKELQ